MLDRKHNGTTYLDLTMAQQGAERIRGVSIDCDSLCRSGALRFLLGTRIIVKTGETNG